MHDAFVEQGEWNATNRHNRYLPHGDKLKSFRVFGFAVLVGILPNTKSKLILRVLILPEVKFDGTINSSEELRATELTD